MRSTGVEAVGRVGERAGFAEIECVWAGGELQHDAVVEDTARRHIGPTFGVRPIDGGAAGEGMLARASLIGLTEVAQGDDESLTRCRWQVGGKGMCERVCFVEARFAK